MVALGWFVLALVFADEVLAVAAAAVWGSWAGGPLLGLAAALAVVAVLGPVLTLLPTLVLTRKYLKV